VPVLPWIRTAWSERRFPGESSLWSLGSPDATHTSSHCVRVGNHHLRRCGSPLEERVGTTLRGRRRSSQGGTPVEFRPARSGHRPQRRAPAPDPAKGRTGRRARRAPGARGDSRADLVSWVVGEKENRPDKPCNRERQEHDDSAAMPTTRHRFARKAAFPHRGSGERRPRPRLRPLEGWVAADEEVSWSRSRCAPLRAAVRPPHRPDG
jgi:hypothetical protein